MINVETLIDAENVAYNDKGHDYNSGSFPCKVDSRAKAVRFAHAEEMFELIKSAAFAFENLAPAPAMPELTKRMKDVIAKVEASKVTGIIKPEGN